MHCKRRYGVETRSSSLDQIARLILVARKLRRWWKEANRVRVRRESIRARYSCLSLRHFWKALGH
jgi:hypothetical protein